MRRVVVRMLACVLWLASPAVRAEDEVIELQVGETRILSHPGVKRVAIGNGQVIGAIEAEGREVVVFARARVFRPCTSGRMAGAPRPMN